MSVDEFPGLNADYRGYDPVTDTVHARHEWNGEQPLVITIVRAVAAVTDTEPTALDPLYEVIDPDALERFLRPAEGADREAVDAVQFTYHDHHVTVDSDGGVSVACDPE